MKMTMHTFDTTYYLAPGEAGLLGEHYLVRILGVPVRVTTDTGDTIQSEVDSASIHRHVWDRWQQASMRPSITPFPCMDMMMKKAKSQRPSNG
jgi:hypothetical protein